jgi:hypothetical protein
MTKKYLTLTGRNGRVEKPAMNEPSREIRKFGIIMCLFFGLLGTISLIKGGTLFPYLLGVAILFVVLALAAPKMLVPVHKAWMKLAEGLGWVNTRIILGVVFYTLFTPIGIISRLLGLDILDQKFHRPELNSYWKKREKLPFDKERWERQF